MTFGGSTSSDHSYDFETMHEHMGKVYKYDAFLEAGKDVAVLPFRHADAAGTSEVVKIWTDAQLKNHAGGGHMSMEFAQCLGGFRLIHECSGISEVRIVALIV
jgi:hypothetical protein